MLHPIVIPCHHAVQIEHQITFAIPKSSYHYTCLQIGLISTPQAQRLVSAKSDHRSTPQSKGTSEMPENFLISKDCSDVIFKLHGLNSLDSSSSIGLCSVSNLVSKLICPCSGTAPKDMGLPGAGAHLVVVPNAPLIGKACMFSTSSKADATFLKSVGRPMVIFDGRIGLRSLDCLEWLSGRLCFHSARRHGRFAQMTDEQASSPDHMTIPMSAPAPC